MPALIVFRKKTLYLQLEPEKHVEMEMPNYPIGKQSFADIRQNGYLYIDKTAFIPLLLKNGSFKFLSRPRRFGKSLLISTLEAYFTNKRDLFKGLAIDRMQPEPWQEYTVLHFDFSGHNYNQAKILNHSLKSKLSEYEHSLGINPDEDDDISLRFHRIVRTSYERTGRGVVILIDEYDNPITSAIDNPELQDELRKILYGFYSSFKSLDQYIHFCILTGVTKYGKMSVFSGLNNLKDISFLDKFAGICGITEAELLENLNPGVEELAKKLNVTTNEAYNRLKVHYDGYHFSEGLIDIYNPFSIINALSDSKILNYWAATGTPTMLIKLLKAHDFDISKLNGAEASLDELGNIYGPQINPKALFYQTGYLTIKSYDPEYQSYFLSFPNLEVERTFMDNLLEIYTEENTNPIAKEIPRALRRGDVKSVIALLKSFLSGIPFDLRKRVAKYENYYHTILYAIFSLIGTEVAAEYHTARGSIDMIIRTNDYIYILELKVNGTAEEAIAQIREKGYAEPFATDPRKTILIGLGFSKDSNTITSDKVEPEI